MQADELDDAIIELQRQMREIQAQVTAIRPDDGVRAAWERLEAAIYRQIDPFEGTERADALNGLAALVEQA